jgi:hypothetical protein
MVPWSQRCLLESCSSCAECGGATPEPTSGPTPAPSSQPTPAPSPGPTSQPTAFPTPALTRPPTPAPTPADTCQGRWVLGSVGQTKGQACATRGMVCSPTEEIAHNPEIDTESELQQFLTGQGVSCDIYGTPNQQGEMQGRELPMINEIDLGGPNGYLTMCSRATSPRSSSPALAPGCNVSPSPNNQNSRNARLLAYCCRGR